MREPAWWGNGPVAAGIRGALTPLELAFRAGVALRHQAFARGVLAVHRAARPVIAVGNISVGGTGKTPVTAWLAGEVVRRGRTPAILLRGYGDDEPAVHRTLTPEALVIPDPDRVRGAGQAAREGADVLLLDDGFQHRRLARDLDVVLLSADVPWATRLLPVGPLREPVAALGRADVVLVTSREDAGGDVASVAQRALEAGAREVGVLRLSPVDLRPVLGSGAVLPLDSLQGASVLAVSAIANPRAFHGGLAARGARVSAAVFPDHHPFRSSDVEELVARARGHAFVVCTLKDAVKLQGIWPQSGPGLWYVSQRVAPLSGTSVLERALDRACRRPDTPSS